MLANQLIADAPDIHDPNLRIGLELLAQLGDENVHAAGVEETVVAPKGNQDRLPAQHVVGVLHEHSEDLGLAIGEAFDLVARFEGDLPGELVDQRPWLERLLVKTERLSLIDRHAQYLLHQAGQVLELLLAEREVLIPFRLVVDQVVGLERIDGRVGDQPANCGSFL